MESKKKDFHEKCLKAKERNCNVSAVFCLMESNKILYDSVGLQRQDQTVIMIMTKHW